MLDFLFFSSLYYPGFKKAYDFLYFIIILKRKKILNSLLKIVSINFHISGTIQYNTGSNPLLSQCSFRKMAALINEKLLGNGNMWEQF